MLLLPRQQFQWASVESWVVKCVALRHLQASSWHPAEPGGVKPTPKQRGRHMMQSLCSLTCCIMGEAPVLTPTPPFTS